MCKAMGDLAEVTMQARQARGSRRELDQMISGELPEWRHKGASAMTNAAWQEPVESNAHSRREVVSKFAAAITLDCMLRQFPESREGIGAQSSEKSEPESNDGSNK